VDETHDAHRMLIHVANLTKTFSVFDRREGVKGALLDLVHRKSRTLAAVDGISFDVARGEIVGYIGQNGAGKSTTIKMLTGILVPTSGALNVDGLVPHANRRAFAKRIGVVFGQRTQLWWDIAAIESFRLLGKIYEVDDKTLAERLDRLDAILELKPLLHTPVRKLSLGQRMRCDIAASLLHAPPILFLDEPTIGLDVVAKDSIRAFLKEINKTFSTTILLTTHDLRDIEELCRRVIVIDRGKILFDGALSEMKTRYAGRMHVGIDVAEEIPLDSVRAAVGGNGVEWEQIGPRRFRASFERAAKSPAELIRAVMGKFAIADVSIEEASIEEVVRRMYGSTNEAARSPAGHQ
jgi:ABC-2 type transport system ATP-binding protein